MPELSLSHTPAAVSINQQYTCSSQTQSPKSKSQIPIPKAKKKPSCRRQVSRPYCLTAPLGVSGSHHVTSSVTWPAFHSPYAISYWQFFGTESISSRFRDIEL